MLALQPRIGTTEFAAAVRRYALEHGAPPDHPGFAGRFARRVAAVVVDGHIEAERMGGRWYVRPDLAQQAAEIMGLVPSQKDKAVRA